MFLCRISLPIPWYYNNKIMLCCGFYVNEIIVIDFDGNLLLYSLRLVSAIAPLWSSNFLTVLMGQQGQHTGMQGCGCGFA